MEAADHGAAAMSSPRHPRVLTSALCALMGTVVLAGCTGGDHHAQGPTPTAPVSTPATSGSTVGPLPDCTTLAAVVAARVYADGYETTTNTATAAAVGCTVRGWYRGRDISGYSIIVLGRAEDESHRDTPRSAEQIARDQADSHLRSCLTGADLLGQGSPGPTPTPTATVTFVGSCLIGDSEGIVAETAAVAGGSYATATVTVRRGGAEARALAEQAAATTVAGVLTTVI